ncbi:hypothetical protein BRADI_3g50336v3 [Brachypodium distachyon]|uniref:Uncharacterized protein n=1 Tax=Brachypodium distachyon TaxID=15368 RepID=A0A2K2D4F0_BRADI|nr:hypothetical protein BRADI_3g50336v3 [Brachypodium distachyon]
MFPADLSHALTIPSVGFCGILSTTTMLNFIVIQRWNLRKTSKYLVLVWISHDRAGQHEHPICSHVSDASRRVSLIPSVGLQNFDYYYNVKFHHDPTVESSESFETPSAVWNSHARVGQHKHPNCSPVSHWLKKSFVDPFGEIACNCVYYYLLKFHDDPTVQSPKKLKTPSVI